MQSFGLVTAVQLNSLGPKTGRNSGRIIYHSTYDPGRLASDQIVYTMSGWLVEHREQDDLWSVTTDKLTGYCTSTNSMLQTLNPALSSPTQQWFNLQHCQPVQWTAGQSIPCHQEQPPSASVGRHCLWRVPSWLPLPRARTPSCHAGAAACHCPVPPELLWRLQQTAPVGGSDIRNGMTYQIGVSANLILLGKQRTDTGTHLGHT